MLEQQFLLFVLFNVFVLLMLALDLGVFHKQTKPVSMKEATVWSIVWIVLAFLFNLGVLYYTNATTAMEFLAGYLLERALSIDNIFVFVLIFSYFGVPASYQHRVLFWGVLGALVMRAGFIAAGTVLIAQFSWILYLFGVILVASGWKMMTQDEIEVHPEKNVFIRLARKLFPMVTGYESPNFFIRKGGKIHVTTMFLVLLTVETTDVVFAVDSIPAVFGVTRDPFIIYSSNVFAILGLRAMYFMLAGVMTSFYYVKHGLSLVLVFIGIKMLIVDFVHIPISISLSVIAGILIVASAASLVRKRRMSSRQKSVD